MSSLKSAGPKLYFSQYGGEQPIPPQFIAAMQRREERQKVPNDVMPDPLSDTVIESKVETDTDVERKKTTVFKKPGNIVLHDIRTTDQGQPVQVQLTLFPTGTTPTPPSATANVAVRDLGNGWSIQEVGVEGSYVNGVFTPGVLGNQRFERERPILTPIEFRPAIPTITTRVDSAGVAIDPTLSGDEIRESQEQISAFKKRVETTTQTVPTLPVTLDQGRDTNEARQNVFVTRKLLSDGDTAEVPTAVKQVKVEQLGDGTKVQETRAVVQIFDEGHYSAERPVLTPLEFRPSIPTITQEVTQTGTSEVPLLSDTEIRRTDNQIDKFLHRTSVVTQADPPLPITLDKGRDTNASKQNVVVTRKLIADSTVPDVATALKDVKVDQLGDGRKVQETREKPTVFPAAEFTAERPVLTPSEFRPPIPTISTQVDAAGTAVAPTLTGTEISETQQQLDTFTKRTKVTSQDTVVLPVVLDKGRATNDDKQDVVVVRKLISDATLPDPATALTDVKVEQIGDGTKVQETRTKPSVFPRQAFEAERPVLTPPEFRPSIPRTSVQTDAAGTASAPTLTGSQISVQDQQLDTFTHRTKVDSQNAAVLPVVLNKGKDTNDRKQVVSVQRTLMADITVPASPTVLRDVRVEQLGDGTKVEEIRDILALFGAKLYVKEVPDTVPQEFRVAVPISTTEEIIAGTAAVPTLGAGDLMKSEQQVTELTKLVKALTRAGIVLPVTLISLDTNQDKQTVTITRTLRVAGANPSPTALRDVEVQNLGDGNVVETKKEIGSIFTRETYVRQLNESFPPKFVATKATTTVEDTEIGTATDPGSLAANELRHEETQLNAFLKSVRSVMRAALTFPASLTGYQTNRDKQLETVVETLKVAGVATAPTATSDVDVENLGNGYMVEKVITRPSIFSANEFGKEIPDLVPEEMRASIPTTETATTVAGTAAVPTLGVNDLSRREVQVDSFLKRIYAKTRSIVGLPVTITNFELTEEFGGGTLRLNKTLAMGIQSILSGLTFTRASVKDLGNGTSLMETAEVTTPAWPTLQGTQVDETTKEVSTTFEQVVAAGTLGGVSLVAGVLNITEALPIDKWRTKLRTRQIPVSFLDSYNQVWNDYVDISADLPVELLSLTAYPFSNFSNGSYNESGGYVITAPGSGGMSVRGTADSSGAAGIELGWTLDEPWGRKIVAGNLLFFIPTGQAQATVLARIATMLGVGSVLAWPRFTPRAESFVLRSGHVEQSGLATASARDDIIVNSQGIPKGSGSSFSVGTGKSGSVGVIIKVLRLPPTIHGALVVGGTTSATASFNSRAIANVAGHLADTGVLSGSVGTDISPTTVTSTGNQTTIPSTGFYLHTLRVEPYKYDYLKAHAVVVNAALF